MNIVPKIWYVADEKTPLSVAQEAALVAYPQSSEQIKLFSDTKSLLFFLNTTLWYQKDFVINQPINQHETSVDIKDGTYNIQNLNNELPCLDQQPTVQYNSASLTPLQANNQNIDQANNLIEQLSAMNKLLADSGIPVDNSAIEQLHITVKDLQAIQDKIVTDVCVTLPPKEVVFNSADYSCPVPQVPQPFTPVLDIDLIEEPIITPTNPSDLPIDCYNQLQDGLDKIIEQSHLYTSRTYLVEQLRKKYYISQVTLAVENYNITIYNKLIDLLKTKSNVKNTLNEFYLSDSETLALFNNNVDQITFSDVDPLTLKFNSTVYQSKINSAIKLISEDYAFNTINSGTLLFPNFFIADEPANVDWFAENINYQYFNNVTSSKLNVYYQYTQLQPNGGDIANFQASSTGASDWIANREKQKNILISNIDSTYQLIINDIIKSNLTIFYSIFRTVTIDGIVPKYKNVFQLGMLSALQSAVARSQNNIIFCQNVIDRFNSIDYFVTNFSTVIKDMADTTSNLPCLPKSKDSTTTKDFPLNINSDGTLNNFYIPNANMPFLDKLSYWLKFAALASITSLNPANWAYGLIIPTSGGPIGVPMPILWIPLSVIPTPTGLYVIFIGQCGIMPAPYVFNFSGVSTTTGFLLSLRGSSDPVKLKPALIRNKTKSMISPSLNASLLSPIDPHKNSNIQYLPTLDQKKFTIFPSSLPLKFPAAASLISKASIFASLLPVLTQTFTKLAFGVNKTGLQKNTTSTQSLPNAFIQDDLPPYDRLTLSNPPFLLYLNQFSLIGSYCGGIPASVPSNPKLQLPIPPALPDLPETFL